MRTLKNIFFITFIITTLAACSLPVTRVDIQSFGIKKPGVDLDKAVSKLTGILVEQGYDIKVTNKDAGIVTTEYKKVASSGTNPPFDYYMQVKARIKLVGNETSIELFPMIKEQNRMNAGAFTERELGYYTGDPGTIRLVPSMHPDGWRSIAQTAFSNLVSGVADAFGVKQEDIVQNVTKTPENAFMKTEQM